MLPIIYCVLFFVFLILSYSILRYFKWLAFFVYLGIPLLFTPYYMLGPYEHNVFIWYKFYSIEISTTFFLFCRYTRLGSYSWISLITKIILIVNILEAITQNSYTGFTTDRVAFLFNALSGLLLIFALPKQFLVTIDRNSERDFLVNLDFGWIVAYTLWNWLVVYLEWPDFAGVQAAIILSPFAIMLFNQKVWLQARAMTLGLYLILHFWNYEWFDPLKVSEHHNILAANLLAAASVVLSAAMLIKKYK